MSNLFIARDQTLITPNLSRCGVAGVQRERILDLAPERNIPIRIETFGVDAMLQADEIFLVNSLIGLWQIRELSGKRWGKGETAGKMRRWLDEVEV